MASRSAIRADLLRGAGLQITVRSADVDEDFHKAQLAAQGAPLGEAALKLAEMKALRVSDETTGLVIGADQMLGLDGRRFDKPKSREEARSNLQVMRGRSHTLFTAACVASGRSILWRCVTTPEVVMRAWSDEALDAYLDLAGDDLLQTVGGYKLEGLGAHLIEAVKGDNFSILGLPLLELLGFLRDRGALQS